MKRTITEITYEQQILRTDPQRYVEMMSARIAQDPGDASAYFSRHLGWDRLKRFDLALADLNQTIALEESPIRYLSRGHVWCCLGDHAEALRDFDRAEALAPEKWLDYWGPLFQANSHACLGNAREALAACARLREDFWSPGLYGTPVGSKQEIIAEIRRRLARRNRRGGA